MSSENNDLTKDIIKLSTDINTINSEMSRLGKEKENLNMYSVSLIKNVSSLYKRNAINLILFSI